MSKEKRFKNLDSETKSTYFYGIIFLFLIVVALVVKFIPNKEKEEKSVKENTTIEETFNYKSLLNNISDNYELDIIINKYYFNEYINIKKQGLNEIIDIKKYDSNNTYNQDDTINEDIDMTFITPQSILRLLNINTYNDGNKYMIESSNYLKLYNELNNTNLEKIVSGEISIEFLSHENNEYVIKMDLTNLYKNLNYDYESVTYNLKFYNINKINLSNNN